MSEEPKLDVVCSDEMTALEVGRAVQEAELDATVRAHPWLPPGQVFAFSRAAMKDWWPTHA